VIIGIDNFLSGSSPDNFDKVRGRTLSSKLQVSRDSSMSSIKSLVVYHEKMECNNTIDVDVSPALLYETTQKKVFCVSEAANISNNMVTMTHQRVSNKHTNMMSTYGDDTVINVVTIDASWSQRGHGYRV